ncbi:MAG: hypothetical protein IJI49_03200 [Bacilli bacterium]|nr:hypothetical protein [Bacilli bacterium]
MFGYIGIFFPSIIGLFALEKLLKEYKFKKRDYIYYYTLLNLFSNSLCMIIFRLFSNTYTYIETNLEIYSMYFVKYVLLSIIINIALAIIITCIKKYIKISIEVQEKNDN